MADACREYVEAVVLRAVMNSVPLLSPEALGVSEGSYLEGVGDAIGELRRIFLNTVIEGDVERARGLLGTMEELYEFLLEFDYPGALSKPERRNEKFFLPSDPYLDVVSMPPKTISLVYNESHMLHVSGTASPENPERLERIIRYLRGRTSLFTDGIAKLITEFKPAGLEELQMVHDPNYIAVIERLCQKGHVFLGDSTYLAPNSFKAAVNAAGGTIEAVRGVLDSEYPSSFALLRPPGHHASADRFGGYCIFNNLAIAARWAQRHRGVKRVMFVDLDAHAGNGTMRIFYDDPTVFTISLHRDPHDYYPQDGFGHQIGTGDGRGYCANIEMPEGSGNEEYALAFETIVLPLVSSFSPDLIIVPIGFDAHYTELHTGLQMTTNGYYRLVSALRVFQKPTVLGLEGGYNKANPIIAHAVVHALVNLPFTAAEEHDQLSVAVTRRLSTHTILKGKLKEMRALLADYHNL